MHAITPMTAPQPGLPPAPGTGAPFDLPTMTERVAALAPAPSPHATGFTQPEQPTQPTRGPRAGGPANLSAGDPDAPGRRDGLIPAPPADGITIGGVKLHAYGAIMATGGMAAGAVALKHLRATGVPTAGLAKVVAPAVVAGLVGARAYHVATDWEKYRDRPTDALKIWEGGLGIYGGVAAGLAVAAVLAHRAHLPIAPLLDAAAIGLPVAQAIGRFGNYTNQELFGRPTDLPWGLQVDPAKRPAGYEDRNSFHPTFAYEAVGNAALAGGLFALSRTWQGRPPGIMLPLYAMGYGAIRFGVESLRMDESKEYAGLRTNQWSSLAVMGAGALGAAAMLARR